MIKTVSLTAGTETKVEISGGYNVAVINRTTGMLYASRKSGISAGADDVAAIPAGDSYVIRAADDTVYLLATVAGDVQLESLGAKEVFKIAAARSSSGGGEGGAIDAEARVAIETHANNTHIHLTAEKAIEAAATAISNPNLLINPDFKINQRGKTEYVNANSTETYSVDQWTIIGTVRKTEDNVIISPENSSYGYGRLLQHIPYDYTGVQLALSAKINGEIKSVTGVCGGEFVEITNDTNDWRLRFIVINSETIVEIIASEETTVKWVKLELGSVATPFTPPDPATELAKCQRYYQLHTTGDIGPVDLRPSMATITDIREREDGKYEYIAEL